MAAVPFVIAVGTAPELISTLEVLGACKCVSAHENNPEYMNPQLSCSLSEFTGLSGVCV